LLTGHLNASLSNRPWLDSDHQSGRRFITS